MKVVVRGASAIVLDVAPVHQMVVDEAAIEDDAVVRRERPRDHVGGVGVRPAVRGRTEPAFGVGLQHEAAKIGNRAVDARPRDPSRTPPRARSSGSNVSSPPIRRGLLKSIDTESATPHGRNASAMRASCGMNAVGDHQRIGVDVVDRRAVDADRRQQAAVVADAGEIVERRDRSRRRSIVRRSRARSCRRGCPSD